MAIRTLRRHRSVKEIGSAGMEEVDRPMRVPSRGPHSILLDSEKSNNGIQSDPACLRLDARKPFL
jgi:hypothetical protein